MTKSETRNGIQFRLTEGFGGDLSNVESVALSNLDSVEEVISAVRVTVADISLEATPVRSTKL